MGLTFERINSYNEDHQGIYIFTFKLLYNNNLNKIQKNDYNDLDSDQSDFSLEVKNSLRNRLKSQHLSNNQIVWIYKQLKKNKQKDVDIILKFEISSATIKRIIQSLKNW